MNVFLEGLPDEWNGYQVNTWFQIGIQIALLIEDSEVSEFERQHYLQLLLFGNEDGTIRECPEGEDFNDCFRWFMGGWNLDRAPKDEENDDERLMDYTVDQGRIYADFKQIYQIDLLDADLHWWEFQWLLWNMPRDRSAFMQAIEIRTKKPRKGATAEERKAIKKAKAIYGLPKRKPTYSVEEKAKIDAYDKRMEALKNK